MQQKIFYTQRNLGKFFEYALDTAIQKLYEKGYVNHKNDSFFIAKKESPFLIEVAVRRVDRRNATSIAKNLQCLNCTYHKLFFECTLVDKRLHCATRRKVVEIYD